MAFCTNFIMPAGTNVETLINLPLCNGWNGGVVLSLVATSSISVSKLDFKRDAGAAGIITRVITPFTLDPDERLYWVLERYESMAHIIYTSASAISLCIETKPGAPQGVI